MYSQWHSLPQTVQRTLEWCLALPIWAAFKLWEPLHGPRRRSLLQLHDNLTPPIGVAGVKKALRGARN